MIHLGMLGVQFLKLLFIVISLNLVNLYPVLQDRT